MVWAFDQECPSPAAKLVLIKLADHADDEGRCWPSQSRVAADCGLTRETVNRQVKALCAAGLLTTEQRINAAGQQANLYLLRCDIPSQPCDLRSHPPVISRHTEPSIDQPLEEREAIASPKKATRLPGDWWPDSDDVAFSDALGLVAADVAAEFCDYWRSAPGQRGVKLDWHATWRNWCRRARPPPGSAKASPVTNLYEGAHRAVEAVTRRLGLDSGAGEPPVVALLDGGRPASDAPGTDGRLDRRPDGVRP